MTQKKSTKKGKVKAKKMPTPAEKQAVADASLPPKGIKVKSKWSRDSINKAIDQLHSARSIISVYRQNVVAVKPDKRAWSDNYYLKHQPGALSIVSQLITNLCDARERMS